ncbi:hypothetical protein [Natrinema sp. SYSU A 869]|uniref:hypothetical protein n=1 Tax=Natrinema sp. SYSU A 869 TaxID=2871694 RepID=UPI001CA45EBA|nr:hypothetical protein [Natrinema sp. SYSU A 869]
MLDGLASGIHWDQIGISIFVSAVLIRDVRERRDSWAAARSTIDGLIGCAFLAANGVLQPAGLVLLGPATLLFSSSLAMHLLTRGWRSDGSPG